MITTEFFNKLFPVKGLNVKKYSLVRRRDELINALNKFLPVYGIDNYLRVCAFFSCCGVETDYFKTTEEYASGNDYDTRTDLGNTPERDGDGAKYKGSSLIQTTGLFNFWRVTVRFVKKKTGRDWAIVEKRYKNFLAYTRSADYVEFLKEANRLGVNFIGHPEMLRENIEIAVEAACIFWEENNLNYYADRGLIKKLNAIVNRGNVNLEPLHWAKRNELYSLCKRRVPANFSFQKIVDTKPSMDLPTAPIGERLSEPVAAPSPASPVMPPPSEPVVLTPTEPANDDSFLSDALDRNLSADEAKEMAKTALPSFAARLWKFIARPVIWIYTALEAGNIAAWLGVVVVIGILIYIIYLNRASIKKACETLKNKFTK